MVIVIFILFKGSYRNNKRVHRINKKSKKHKSRIFYKAILTNGIDHHSCRHKINKQQKHTYANQHSVNTYVPLRDPPCRQKIYSRHDQDQVINTDGCRPDTAVCYRRKDVRHNVNRIYQHPTNKSKIQSGGLVIYQVPGDLFDFGNIFHRIILPESKLFIKRTP